MKFQWILVGSWMSLFCNPLAFSAPVSKVLGRVSGVPQKPVLDSQSSELLQTELQSLEESIQGLKLQQKDLHTEARDTQYNLLQHLRALVAAHPVFYQGNIPVDKQALEASQLSQQWSSSSVLEKAQQKFLSKVVHSEMHQLNRLHTQEAQNTSSLDFMHQELQVLLQKKKFLEEKWKLLQSSMLASAPKPKKGQQHLSKGALAPMSGFFESQKGVLASPIPQGKILSVSQAFALGIGLPVGQDVVEPQAVFHENGLFIEPYLKTRSPSSASVQAVFSGRVIFSGWQEGLGRVLIVEHPGDYFTLYARLSKVFKKKNDTVKAQEAVGLSDIGQAVYFELRYGRKILNAKNWLASTKSVQ